MDGINDPLKDVSDIISGSVSQIRASNKEAAELSLSQRKREARLGKRKQDLGPIQAHEAAALKEAKKAKRDESNAKLLAGQHQGQQGQQNPRPRTTMADVKMAQHMHEKSENIKPSFLAKRRILGRYMGCKLWPVLLQNGDPKILNSRVATEKDLDLILDHIRSTLKTLKIGDYMDSMLYFACDAFDKYSNHGAMFNMNINGFANEVMEHKDDIDVELEEFKCEYGDYMGAPLPLRILGFLSKRAVILDSKNKFGQSRHMPNSDE